MLLAFHINSIKLCLWLRCREFQDTRFSCKLLCPCPSFFFAPSHPPPTSVQKILYSLRISSPSLWTSPMLEAPSQNTQAISFHFQILHQPLLLQAHWKQSKFATELVASLPSSTHHFLCQFLDVKYLGTGSSLIHYLFFKSVGLVFPPITVFGDKRLYIWQFKAFSTCFCCNADDTSLIFSYSKRIW